VNVFISEIIKIAIANKYTKWYCNLIQKNLQTSQSVDQYSELHHIYPKSIQCDIDVKQKLNIVRLTAREHFIAHLLLTKMFKNAVINQKMNFAFFQLRLSNRYQQRYTNSRFYEKVKKVKRTYIRFYNNNKCVYADVNDLDKQQLLIAQGWSTVMPEQYKIGRVGNMKGKRHSEETRRRMSESGKKVDRSNFKKPTREERLLSAKKAQETRRYNESLDPIGTAIKRKEQSDKQKQLYRSGILSHAGEKNPRYGKPCRTETKQKISELSQRRGNAGYTHEELYNTFIKPNNGMSIDQLISILPVKKTRFCLKKLIAKFNS
jgi:hypothetical protein